MVRDVTLIGSFSTTVIQGLERRQTAFSIAEDTEDDEEAALLGSFDAFVCAG